MLLKSVWSTALKWVQLTHTHTSNSLFLSPACDTSFVFAGFAMTYHWLAYKTNLLARPTITSMAEPSEHTISQASCVTVTLPPTWRFLFYGPEILPRNTLNRKYIVLQSCHERGNDQKTSARPRGTFQIGIDACGWFWPPAAWSKDGRTGSAPRSDVRDDESYRLWHANSAPIPTVIQGTVILVTTPEEKAP